MSYIGKEPQVGAYHMLDSLTASATADYTLQLDSVNFVPESANHLIVSLNGVIQKAGSSFTVSGSTLSFSSALTSSDSIDFVLSLGNVLDIGTPSDSTVTNAKTNFVSTSSSAGLQIKGDNTTAGTLQLNCEQNSHGIKLRSPSHSAGASYTLTFPTTDGNADEFLQTNGSGTLTWASAGGIEMVDQWRITSDHSGVADVTANWERNDNSEYGSIGTGMSESSGIFTFPSTGIYRVDANCTLYISGGGSDYTQVQIKATTDNSSYSASSIGFGFADGADKYSNIHIVSIIDVTNTTNVKVKLSVTQNSANTPKLAGSTSLNRTYMTFTRLGDT